MGPPWPARGCLLRHERSFLKPALAVNDYNLDLPAALAFAHLALANSESRFLAAGLTFRLRFCAGLAAGLPRLIFAHLALAAAEMAARPAALIFLFLGLPAAPAALAGAEAPTS